MCGIAGIIRTDGGPVDGDHLRRMRDALVHRGPDGNVIWTSDDGSRGLVHLRLAIIDPDPRSDQPMTTADGALTIIFNGEIFNFLEIRDELEAMGVRFRTESDTEVLLEAWRKWGSDTLLKLNGMWAFALFDNRSGEVHFARDRFGIKPFLYAQCGDHFAFASEMRGLLALPFIDQAVDEAVAARLLFEPMGIEGSTRTLHKSISRLPGGHYARLKGRELDVRRWWRTADHLVEAPARFEEASERFRELFLDSVRLRMRSDVRIGTCLSGGFDSTAIVSGMAAAAGEAGADHRRESDDWRHAFIASFAGHGHDETEQARIAAEHARVVPHFAELGADSGEDDIDRVLDALDDIYISLPTAPWKIYRGVHREGIRVTLDGHGADELIGAYFRPGHLSGFVLRNLLAGRAGASDRVRHFGLRLSGDYFLRGYAVSPPPALRIAALEDRLPAHWGPLDRRLYGMFHATVLPTILRNFDRLSMAHGVEVRMPFMDWRLVVFAMSLPQRMKFADGRTKLIAREAMRGLMPESIRTESRKIGFNSQIPAWMNGSLGAWALRLIEARDESCFSELVDTGRLARRIRRLNDAKGWDWHQAGRLWPYINLKWYMRRLTAGAAHPQH